MSRDRRVQGAIVGAALLLAAWSLLPLSIWWDATPPSYYAGAWQTWGWGSAVAGLAVLLVLALGGGRVPAVFLLLWRALRRVRPGVFAVACALLLAALTVLCTIFVFDGNPRNVDGFAQLFHAQILLAGRLWNAPPAELANFATLQMILGPDKWLSQYPPGQSFVLAAGLALGAWWILHPLLVACFALATWRVARWCAGEAAARIALLVLCISPFVIAVAASEMSHLAAATLGMGAAAFAVMAAEGPFGWAALSGLLLGLMTAFRPLDAVAAALPAGLILLSTPRRVPAFAAVVGGGLLGSLPILCFNAVANGSPATFGYTVLWGAQHSLGFHPVPWGVPLTLTRAIARSGMDLHQLNTYFLDGTIPVLLVVAAGYLAGRRFLATRDGLPFAAVLALVGILFFYWHRDIFYGPRFLYSVVAWFAVMLARALVLLRRSWPREDGRGIGLTAAFAVAMSLIVGLVSITPGRVRAYRQSTPVFSLHPDRDAMRQNLVNAVVLIPDGWGTRLIARMWQLGIPVRRSSRLYAAIDACTLERALGAAEADTTSRARLAATLDSLASLGRPGARVLLTDDANLRLQPDQPLAPACRTEIDVDRRGYYSFAPFLWLNRASLDGNIVWARDLGPGNAALFRRYAGRPFYRYAPDAPRGGHPAFYPVEGPGW